MRFKKIWKVWVILVVFGITLLLGNAMYLTKASNSQQITLTVQTYHSTDQTTGTGYYLLQQFKQYEKLHPNVKIIHNYVPFGELVKKLIVQAMSKKMPDIVFADNPDVQYLARSGVFKDITNIVKKWGIWNDFTPGSQLAVTYKGKIWALHHDTNNLALWYNKDYFKQAGITVPPKTWGELLEVCKKLKGKLPKNVYPIGFSATNTEEATWQFEPFLWSNGGNLLALDRKESIEALNLWATLVKNGYAPRDVLNWGQGDLTTYFKNKRLVMIIQGCWELTENNLADFKKHGLVYGINFDITYIPVPQKGRKVVVPAGGECFALPSTSKSPKEEVAVDLLKFLYDSKNMAEFCKNTGRIPTRKSAIDIMIKERPDLKVFAEQAKNALPRPAAGGGEKYTQISAITREAIQKVLSGSLGAQKAFSDAAEKIRKLFTSESEYKQWLKEADEALKKVSK
ncbi:extracellular solute-binding protein family 1 [Caldicellulosiruptor hydrothermalis 108]|uniref:Extracellular solute-binding protein family 1 n=1 Tax=Caldicellulosiruptor hydrothermalis (strain DSM 18901 / VKM B-2411 / 108) TaxID=632292 RepID=E4QDL9_CALH1|nr:sugar ABC transporter substrate-binding protein [Caldicellulosiruptor hydrothermalis]ADQ06436.1 extracellular solute-binding protein family 1 [Caldicellulosiruptor hydrothermalis 108]